MSNVLHDAECNLHHDESEKARRAWQEKWPSHCIACEGEGGKVEYGGWDTPPDFEPCPKCQEGDDLRCPRCGAAGETWNETTCDTVTCNECGWDPNRPDTCPPAWECWGECEG